MQGRAKRQDELRLMSDALGKANPLFNAVMLGKIEAMQPFIDEGADLNAQDVQGRTLLCAAAYHGHFPIVAYLIEKKARINDPDAFGTTALCAAAQKGHHSTVELLILHGAEVNQALVVSNSDNGATPLYAAAEKGHVTIVDQLLNAGAYVDAMKSGNFTPLYVAAAMGHVPVVVRLMAAGANVHRQGEIGKTPFGKAIAGGKDEVVSVMMRCLTPGLNVEKFAPGDYSDLITCVNDAESVYSKNHQEEARAKIRLYLTTCLYDALNALFQKMDLGEKSVVAERRYLAVLDKELQGLAKIKKDLNILKKTSVFEIRDKHAVVEIDGFIRALEEKKHHPSQVVRLPLPRAHVIPPKAAAKFAAFFQPNGNVNFDPTMPTETSSSKLKPSVPQCETGARFHGNNL